MSDGPNRLSELVDELKRRHVFRVAAAYAVVAFVVLQVAEIAFPALYLPDWALTLVVILAVLGFPMAVVLAWAFEVTPEGVRKTGSDAHTDFAPAQAGRRPEPGRHRPAFWVGVVALAIIAGGLFLFRDAIPGRNGLEGGAIRRIAVLPLSTHSEDPQQEFFSQAMTEALTHELAQVGALHVISRTSASRYVESGKRVTEIAEELNVDAVVEGSVLLTGDEVRITAQLIDARTDHHLWSNEYDRRLEDILSLQKEVARQIAREVEAELTPQEERLLAGAAPVVPEAYREYVRGRYLWNQRRPDAIREAIEHFERAIEIDPTYALAWAGLADCYLVPAAPFPPATRLPRAKAAATQALDLNADLAEAHTALAYAIMQLDFNWEGAGRHFQRGIELNPGYATGHQWYAEHLMAVGRADEAVERARKAVELDPLSGIILWNLQRILFFAGRYDESIAIAAQAREIGEYTTLNALYLSWALRLKGEDDEALEVLMRLSSDAEFMPWQPAEDARGRYQSEGWIGFWQALLEEQIDTMPVRQIQVSLLTYMGRYGEALELAELLYRTNNLAWYVTDLAADPALDPLREDPRYHSIMQKVGLDDRSTSAASP